MAFAYDYSLGGAHASQMGRGISIIYRVMNSATIIAAGGLASASKITANEIVAAFNLPVGFLVLGAVLYTKTGGTSAGTVDIGIGFTNDDYLLNASSIATSDTFAATDTETNSLAASSGAMITSTSTDDNHVGVKYNSDDTNSVIVVAVWGIDFSFLTEVV